jgi:hypothetical protein
VSGLHDTRPGQRRPWLGLIAAAALMGMSGCSLIDGPKYECHTCAGRLADVPPDSPGDGFDGGFSRDGSRFVYKASSLTAADSAIAIDVASGIRAGSATFPAPFRASSFASMSVTAISADGQRVLVYRLSGDQNKPMLFDWNPGSGQTLSTLAVDTRYEVTAAAWTNTGFKVAYYDWDGFSAPAPTAALHDVSFGQNDTTAYFRKHGDGLPERFAWAPEAKVAWTSVCDSCYGDQECRLRRFNLYYSTPTSIAQVGTVNGGAELWSSPDGNCLLVDTGRATFVKRR